MIECRSICHVCFRVQDAIIVVGGETWGHGGKRQPLKTCEMLKLRSNRWTQIEPLNCERVSPAAASYNDTMYVFGGCGGTVSDSVEQYDTVAKRWTMLTVHMSVPRHALAAECVGGCFYLLGGLTASALEAARDDFHASNSTPLAECFNPREHQIFKVSPLSAPRYYSCAARISIPSRMLIYFKENCVILRRHHYSSVS